MNRETKPDEKPGINKTTALIVATLSSFLAPFMSSATNIALPAIGRELNAHALTLSWISTSYLMSAAVFLVPFGRISDIFGRKKIFLAGIVIYLMSTVLCVSAVSTAMLIGFRVLQGMGGAMVLATSTAILISAYPPRERGHALGINVTAVYIGLASGPVLGGFLTQYFGWRSIFLINLPFGLAVIALVLTKMRTEWAEARGEKFDFIGSLAYGLSLVSILYGFSKVPAARGFILTACGAAGLVFFAFWELRHASPVLDIRLFRSNPVFAFSNIAAFINYSATFAVGFLLSLYLQYIKGLSPRDAGLVLVFGPAVQAIFSPLAGRLSDRIEPRIVASAGMALTGIGFFLLVFLHEETHLAFIITSIAVFGLGFALFSSPNTNAVMSSVDKKFYGVSSAILGTMRLTGQAFSMGIATLMLAVFLGPSNITPRNHAEYLSSLHVTIVIFTALSLFGIFASLIRGKLRQG